MKLKEKKLFINILFFDVFLIAIFFANQVLGTTDLGQLFKWYLMLLGATIIGYPVMSLLFHKFYDKGYIFSKILGILFPSIIVFFLCNFKLAKFTVTNCAIVYALCIGISIGYLLYKYIKTRKNKDSKEDEAIGILKNNLSMFFRIEVIFFVLLVLFANVKGFDPSVSDIEKFMDYGFMNSMAHSDYLPSRDMWLSGEPINYYYYGHYIATYLSKAAHVSVDYGYNLMLISLFVLTIFASYSIINNLFKFYFVSRKIDNKAAKIFPVAGGVLAALSNTIAGNGHFLIYRYIVPFINDLTGHESSYIYGFPDSTRYIGDNPPTPDKTIHEFPSYSFLVGDLHAHLSDIIYVLVTIAILLSYIISARRKGTSKKKEYNVIESLNIYSIILGFLIGIMKMTNYWDYPIYLVVALITFFFVNVQSYQKFKDAFWCTIIQMLIVFTMANLISLPFVLSFIQISSKIKLAPYHTKFYQFMVLWGIPLVTVTLYMVSSILDFIKEKRDKDIKEKEKQKWYQKVWNAFYGYISNLTDADLFIVIITICAIGLLIAPEIVYVVDIYDTAPRANTMFKLTYNSYIMFSLCFGYMLLRLIARKNKVYEVSGLICLIVFMATFLYVVEPVKSWFGDLTNPEEYETLDGTDFLNSYIIGNYMDEDMAGYVDYNVNMQDDLAMINWLKENANSEDVILEYKGSDFTFDNRISVFTSMPTVLGWVGHEWLWRSVNSSMEFPQELQDRADDIDYIYTSGDIEYNKYLMDNYDIKYIIVGYNERLHISKEDLVIPNEEQLKALGEVVFETNINELPYPSYIIKVKRD